MENMEIKNKLNRIGYKIKSRRSEMKLSLREVARLCGVSASFIGAVENGKNMPSMKKLQEIANALDLTLTYLLDEEATNKNAEILLKNIDGNLEVYKSFLKEHKFPNGLTYSEMCLKLEKLKTLEKIIKA